MILVEYMKVNGLKIREMEMDLNNIKMGMCIKESFKIISQTEKERITGTIMRFMTDNGKMVGKMALEFGKVLKGIHM